MMKNIRRGIAYARVLKKNYDAEKAAIKKLKSIESVKGKTNSNDIKLSNEYAIDVLGWKGYAPWLYVYSAINSKFKEGWIPANYFHNFVIPKFQGDYGRVSLLKPLSKRLFQSEFFPDAAYYVNGLFLDINQKLIKQEYLNDLLFKDSNKIVFKTDNSMQGMGVFVFTKNTFNLEKIYALGNGVFQNFINQHSFFDKYMTNSVATIRLTTIIDNNGKAQLRGCFLRLGRINETHILNSTNIFIPIDINSGELDELGYFPTWNTLKEHPDTKTIFAKNTIPYFEKCKQAAFSLHEEMPHVRCIGWDMVIDNQNEAKVMEWNGYYNDIKFNEATQGPCFSDLGWENLWKK